MNNISFDGRLTRDPETKIVGEGVEVTNFTVASERYMGKDKPTETDFFNCSAFGARGAAIAKYFHKGDQIFVNHGVVRTTKGNTEDTKNITYMNITVNEYSFGAKKNAAASDNPTSKAPTGFTPVDDDTPF